MLPKRIHLDSRAEDIFTRRGRIHFTECLLIQPPLRPSIGGRTHAPLAQRHYLWTILDHSYWAQVLFKLRSEDVNLIIAAYVALNARLRVGIASLHSPGWLSDETSWVHLLGAYVDNPPRSSVRLFQVMLDNISLPARYGNK